MCLASNTHKSVNVASRITIEIRLILSLPLPQRDFLEHLDCFGFFGIMKSASVIANTDAFGRDSATMETGAIAGVPGAGV